MNKIFDPKNKNKLETAERKRILPPDEILISSGLKECMFSADIGCGTGFFTIPMAKIVGPQGKVFAFDISDEMLEELRSKIKSERIENVDVLKSETYSLPIGSESVDFALISNVLHEVDEYTRFLNETKRIMRPGAKLVIIDWIDKETESGPPIHERLSETKIRELLTFSNFEVLDYKIYSNTFHYFLGKKKNEK